MRGLKPFDFDATYTAEGWRGIAWYAIQMETEPDEDTDWSGVENETGKIVCHMVGDDRRFSFDPEQLAVIPEEDFCSECGQVGCSSDGRRSS